MPKINILDAIESADTDQADVIIESILSVLERERGRTSLSHLKHCLRWDFEIRSPHTADMIDTLQQLGFEVDGSWHGSVVRWTVSI